MRSRPMVEVATTPPVEFVPRSALVREVMAKLVVVALVVVALIAVKF